jgi:hypothetical protein
MKVPPTTPAGARAVIEHLVEWDKDGVRETSGQYLATLLRSPLLAARTQLFICRGKAAFGPPFYCAGCDSGHRATRVVVLSLELQQGGQRGASKVSYHQAARIGFRARWLAVELAFYLLALLTLGAQIACLLAPSPT